jgi:hypothetical protein
VEAELRAKYDATTRLLAAQCDTIDRLHAQLHALQSERQLPAPTHRRYHERDGKGCGSSSDGSGGGPEPEHRRPKHLVKSQVR